MPRGPREDDERPEAERWPRGRVDIVVPTTERWKVGETVRDAADGGAARVIRVRASQRESARKAPPVRLPRTVEVAHVEAPDATPSHTAGRSGLVVDEALATLLRQHPGLGALRPRCDLVASAFARLEEHDRERWLGMRNGRPRPIRLPARFDLAPVGVALREALDGATASLDRLALEWALELLESDPHLLWNHAVEAALPALQEEAGATVAALADALPAESPCGLDLPPELAIPLLPYTARWRLGRIAGEAKSTNVLREHAQRRVRTLLDPSLRAALAALAGRVGVPAPAPADDAAWTDVVLACLRQLCQVPDGRLALLAARPAEVSAYVAAGKELLDAGRPFLAELAFVAAMTVTSDPAKALRYEAEAHALLADHDDVLVAARSDHGSGVVVRQPGPEGRWTTRWEPNERWPDEAPVSVLGLAAPILDALLAAGLASVGSLRAADRLDLLALPSVGRSGLRQLLAALESPPP